MAWRVTTDPLAERLRAADLDRYLATLYAPATIRPALFALHALDLELMEVVEATTQPMIGLIRLAWWREALERLDRAPPPAQPLLEALAARVLPLGVTGEDLAAMEAGAAALLEEPADQSAYLEGRSRLFTLAARLSGGNEEAGAVAGRVWAAAERNLPAVEGDFSGAPRQLAGLAVLARKPGPKGSPSRQLRLLWSMLSGR